MPMRIEHVEAPGGIVVIRLSGKVVLGQNTELIETLVTRLLEEGRRKFIFDLSEVTHMDSTGIGRLIASFNQVMENGGRMLLAGATGAVREGFKVTRLDRVFKFLPDLESATQALG